MKKIYTIIAIMFFAAGAFAQTSGGVALPKRQLTEFKQQKRIVNNPNHEKTTIGFWIDLDSADSFNSASVGVGYSRFAWECNTHYVASDTTGGHYGLKNDYMVMFDTLVDTYNAAGPTPYAKSLYPTVSVDSLLLWIGQENNSGIDDTLVVSILGTQSHATGLALYPDTAGVTVYSRDTFFIPATAPLDAGNYIDGYFAVLSPNGGAGVNLPTNKWTVKVQYLGNKLDTFMFVAGCPSFSGANSCAGFTMADSSSYRPNSFYKETQGNFHRYWPTTTDGFLYYECNGTANFQYGVDGSDYIQNIGINAYITATTGMQENSSLGIKLLQNMPNPFNNTTNVSYQLAKRGNVTFEITDLAGRVIMNSNEGSVEAGRHTITLDGKNFSQGVYFYSLNVDGVKLTNRMIITK